MSGVVAMRMRVSIRIYAMIMRVRMRFAAVFLVRPFGMNVMMGI